MGKIKNYKIQNVFFIVNAFIFMILQLPIPTPPRILEEGDFYFCYQTKCISITFNLNTKIKL